MWAGVVVLSGNRNDTKADIIMPITVIYITHAHAKYIHDTKHYIGMSYMLFMSY